MLEPRIHYTRTSDGVNIAYTSFGEGGVPVIALRPPQLSHIGLEADLPFQTRFHEFERMAETMHVVRFDSRGSGLSDRGVEDVSLEARIRDIDAVADRLGLSRFAIQANLHACSWAIAYAAARPERVSHLVLHQPYTRGSDYWNQAARAALESLIPVDWLTYTEASMSHAFGWVPGDIPRALAAQMRAAITPEDFRRYLETDRETDVTPLLERVTCPVLVVHFDMNALTPRDLAVRLAGAVPDGRLALPRSLGDAVRAMSEFLEYEAPAAEPDGQFDDLHLRIVLVANGNTRPGVIEQRIASHGGAAVALMGGTSTGVFGSAQAALGCAQALAEETGASIGVHAGEPGGAPATEADQSLVVAVRASVVAAPGEVVVSNVVRELVAGKGFGFRELAAPVVVPMMTEPLRLFALR
jgi:pimeloyl-ACP methyl ester carboxylesterase